METDGISSLAPPSALHESAAIDVKEHDVSIAPTVSYYQSLASKLGNSIRIVSDNPAAHESPITDRVKASLLPPLYEYNAMDNFMSSLLKEKGLTAPLEIVADNASSRPPQHRESEEEATVDHIDEEVAIMGVDKSIHPMDRSVVGVGRSSSYDAIYSTPTPTPKRSVTRARSFPKNHGRLLLSPNTTSPQSVLDVFHPADAAELRSSFHTLWDDFYDVLIPHRHTEHLSMIHNGK